MTLPSSDPQFALDAYRAMLEETIGSGALYEWNLARFDRLDLPEHGVALFTHESTLFSGTGCGPSDAAAQASAWGQVVALISAHSALRHMPTVSATYYELWQQGRAAADPIALCLAAGSDYTHAQTLQWVEARRYPSNETVLVPIETVAPHLADLGTVVDRSALVQQPGAYGLGVGLTMKHAILSGLLDLVQRDGSSVNMGALDRGGLVDLDDVRDQTTRDLLRYLDEEGVEIMVKLAGLDFGIANLYVVGYDLPVTEAPHPIMLAAHGAAAHPDREQALALALRRFALGRARLAFANASPAAVRANTPSGYLHALQTAKPRRESEPPFETMRQWNALSHQRIFAMLSDTTFSMREQISFADLPSDDMLIDEMLPLLADRVAQAGMEVLYVPFTSPDAPVQVVKVVVPGLEANTMTEHRIGRRNVERLLRRNSPLVTIGELPDGAQRVRLTPEDEYALGGPAWLDTATLDQMVKPLAFLHREPALYPFGVLRKD